MTKFHWKSDEVAEALRAAGLKVSNTGPGGDHDTDELVVELENGEGIFISGWTPEATMLNPTDVEVDAITVGDGRDSRGGLTSNDPTTIQAYADVRKVIASLIDGTDTGVHDHYDELF